MKLKKLVYPFLGLLVIGCSSDDSEGVIREEEELTAADFIAIGQDLENVYQYSFDGTTETGSQINLTAEFNITPNYLTLREVEDLVSFYYFSDGAFSVILKDVRTGAIATYEDFFANSPGRSVAWGINDESNVYFGFFGPSGTRDLGVQAVALQSAAIQDAAIDIDIDFVYQPVLFNGKIYFTYLDNQGDYKFTFYNTAQNAAGPVINFSTTPISFLIAESGDVAIVKNGVDASLEMYDADSLTLLESIPLAFNTAFSAGPINGAVFDGRTLFYAFRYVQPSKFVSGPATFDTQTQQNHLADLFGIAAELEREIGANIGLTVQLYDAIQKVFLVGYEVLDQSARGGILQISAQGDLIANVTTDFVPTYFIRN